MKFDQMFVMQVAGRKTSIGPLPPLVLGPLRHEAGAYRCACGAYTNWCFHDGDVVTRCCSTECFANYAVTEAEAEATFGQRAKSVEWLLASISRSNESAVEPPPEPAKEQTWEQPQPTQGS